MKKILPILLLIAFLNTSAGYVGDLPDLGEAFKEEQKKLQQKHEQEQKKFDSRPFIDVEKDPTKKTAPALNSPKYNDYLMENNPYADYLVEILKLQKPMSELYDASKKENLQLFAAKSYYFNLKANLFLKKYQNKPEEKYVTYKIVKELIRQNQSIISLWQKADYTLQYVSYSSAGGVYKKENIEKNLAALAKNIEILQDEIKLLSE